MRYSHIMNPSTKPFFSLGLSEELDVRQKPPTIRQLKDNIREEGQLQEPNVLTFIRP